MTSYRVTVGIDTRWVQHFQDTKMSLCTAFGVKSNYSTSEYNIIATSEDPTPVNTIWWTETYSISACKMSPALNSPVSEFESITPSKVEVGQSFTISSSWTATTSQISDKTLKKSFQFVNELSAAAVLSKRVRDAVAPVYVSTVGSSPPPPGQHNLSPTGKLLVFFMPQEAGTAFRIKDIATKFVEIPYTDKSEAAMRIQYTKDGLWVRVASDSPPVDEPKL